MTASAPINDLRPPGLVKNALGVVFCRSPLSDLDLAPGSMHVEER